MKKLIVDRFENDFAICEDDNERFFGIVVSELPLGAKEGDVINILNDGTLSINIEETKKRKECIKAKTKKLKSK